MWNYLFGNRIWNPMDAVAVSHEERKSLKRRGIEPIDIETARSMAQINYHLRLLL